MMNECGKERKLRREAAARADANDLPAALALCRVIRDDEKALDADRLKAVELLMRIKGEF